MLPLSTIWAAVVPSVLLLVSSVTTALTLTNNTSEIKNPISLARLVHEHSMHPLSLRRVPPNLLVAQGATEFAVEMGMPILPHDALVSPAAKERWLRWRADLKAAERKGRKAGNHPSSWRVRADLAPEDEVAQRKIREQHTANLLQGIPSVDRFSSPAPSDENIYYTTENTSSTPSDPSLLHSEQSSLSWHSADHVTIPETSDQSPERGLIRPPAVVEASRNALINSTQKVPTISQCKDCRDSRNVTPDSLSQDIEMEGMHNGPIRHAPGPGRKSWGDGSGEDVDSDSSATTLKLEKLRRASLTAINMPLPPTPSEKNIHDPTPRTTTPLGHVKETAPLPPHPPRHFDSLQSQLEQEEDHITDTVGAIAVDSWGNIACGASSGGIGMKYRGRVGPAALVGVGAAVIPIDPEDAEQSCVATVTSGTGEHMATTMAATVCAERLYQSVKKNRGGEYVEVSEDEALKAMIEHEFMGKQIDPGFVLNSADKTQVIRALRTATQLALSVSSASKD
jgi:taspase (threonine aspartase 1)